MGTLVFNSFCFSSKYNQQIVHSHFVGKGLSRTRVNAAISSENGEFLHEESDGSFGVLKRRSALLSGVSLISYAMLGFPGESLATVKQGLLAGRIPGLSEPDEQEILVPRKACMTLDQYLQVGGLTTDRMRSLEGMVLAWSPIIPYLFSVPQEWEEVPVSIADLGGTEIDLRFGRPKEGRLFVIVAPVLRFADNLGDNTTIEKVETPEKVINAFGPEVMGENVEGKVLSMEVKEHSGRKYYQFELEPPHALITATAAGNRLYLFNVTANGKCVTYSNKLYPNLSYHQK